MFDDLTAFGDAVFSTMTQIFNLYTANILFAGVLALWIIRKVVNIYRHL